MSPERIRLKRSLGGLAILTLALTACSNHDQADRVIDSVSPAATSPTPSTRVDATPTIGSPRPSRRPRPIQAKGWSFDGAVSANGRYVAFASDARNLVPRDNNGQIDVFVRDLDMRRTSLISKSSSGRPGNAMSWNPAISADGRYVTFISLASNLVPGDTNMCVPDGEPDEVPSCADALVHDTKTGRTTRVSVSGSGRQAEERTSDVAISGDGHVVVFTSFANNLVPNDTNNCEEWDDIDDPSTCEDVFAHDLRTGTTERVSVDENGHGFLFGSRAPSVSYDGRIVLFYAHFENGGGLTPRTFIRDRATQQTVRVQSNTDTDSPVGVTSDGRYRDLLGAVGKDMSAPSTRRRMPQRGDGYRIRSHHRSTANRPRGRRPYRGARCICDGPISRHDRSQPSIRV